MKIGAKRSVYGPGSLILPLKDKVQVGMLLSLEGDGLDAAPEIKMKLTAKIELKK